MNKVQLLPDGTFDVRNTEGKSLLDRMGGPFRSQETAEAARRMLNALDDIDSQIWTINQNLRSAQGY